MKFALAIASVAAVATAQDAMSQISAKWDALVSVINADLPVLKGANPAIYAQATSVIGGPSITQDFNVALVQQVATGIAPAIMNPVLSRAGITGITLDGKPLPTGAAPTSAPSSSPAPTSASPSSSPTSAPTSSPTSSPSSHSSGASSHSGTSSKASSGSSAASNSDSDSDSDAVSDSDSVSDSGSDSSDTKSNGVARVAAGSLAAAVAVVAALF
ncbi:hypothetical protein IWW39_000578 [Coemansia spiralis]|uniref:Uncharacterized protein n=1 Tax=Coemansia spiralis TaxID=417178 RepID=A0A9W8GRQ4_9FUNG|nr:hypothetical protein IWW39_000578 [Coemansia spiralis]